MYTLICLQYLVPNMGKNIIFYIIYKLQAEVLYKLEDDVFRRALFMIDMEGSWEELYYGTEPSWNSSDGTGKPRTRVVSSVLIQNHPS